MIIQLKGNVTYPITLDPTVWIFDDRKIILNEAFEKKAEESNGQRNGYQKQAELFDQEYNRIKPPVNKSINKYEKEKILVNTYVMPIKDFVNHAEVNQDAERVILKTD